MSFFRRAIISVTNISSCSLIEYDEYDESIEKCDQKCSLIRVPHFVFILNESHRKPQADGKEIGEMEAAL